MHDTLTFNGKKYVTATTAGKHFGYSKEYVLMLIKAGKIEGEKVKHKWFVEVTSVEVYFAYAKQEREARLRKLSEIRKLELENRSAQVSKSPSTSFFSVGRQARVALLETLVIVILGISIGSLSYVGVTAPTASVASSDFEYGFFEELALSVYNFVYSFNSESRDEILSMSHPSNNNSHSVLHGVGTTTHTSFAISPNDLFTLTTTSINSITESFSDDVAVSLDPDNLNTAVITPQFRDGTGEEYRFIMVPVVNTPNE